MTTLDFSQASEVFYDGKSAEQVYYASSLVWTKYLDVGAGLAVEGMQYFDYPILRVRLTRITDVRPLNIYIRQGADSKQYPLPAGIGEHDMFFLMEPTTTSATVTVMDEQGGMSTTVALLTVPISGTLPAAEQFFDVRFDDAEGDQWIDDFLSGSSSALADLRMYYKKLLRISAALPARHSSFSSSQGYYRSLIDGVGANWYDYNRIMVDGVYRLDQVVLPTKSVVFVPPEQFLFNKNQSYRIRLGKGVGTGAYTNTFHNVFVNPTP